MTASRLCLLALFVVLTGCRAIEGTYSPSCVAFAGDSISLREGQYSWNKFTDERRIGPDGKVVDPYPDYPKTGAYELDGDGVRLLEDGGGVLATWYIHEEDGRLILLSQSQQDVWSSEGVYPNCPLALEP